MIITKCEHPTDECHVQAKLHSIETQLINGMKQNYRNLKSPNSCENLIEKILHIVHD